MKRFRFPLQPVAVLRAHREAKAHEAFATAVQAYVKSEEELANTRIRVAQFEASMTSGRQGKFSAADHAQNLSAYRQERAAEAASEQSMLNARGTMNQRRAEYLDAHRKVEVVKRLEQKARVRYQADCNREEQAGFDDLGARRFLTRRPLFSK
jgi:flagellar FliJ protein